jgi:hypothetical protein
LQLGDAPVCLSLASDLVYQVADQKPAQLLLYDYYEPAQQLKSSYGLRQQRSLEENCPDCWPDTAASLHSASRPSAANANANSAEGVSIGLWLLLLAFFTTFASNFWPQHSCN